ncbi:alpha/beta hydrolase [Aggregicoccus sp. 17bor-14]|uniref:alpha/beta fold hydrolase n=1 Tax=Myxococcaceae TaxID=31 RepID=UPI00129D13E9|nr:MULTISPECIES: alpha/beta hydrolase [Myxococcaceae]MBF5045833.1 alpha/beta hydrolase [Simulacricoccus sp. 17bor-14]MRI91567.1 alpha/beta hydrolase [Aggregicoccus sp. 17bor-14]
MNNHRFPPAPRRAAALHGAWLCAALLALGGTALAQQAQPTAAHPTAAHPTVVLVHGAFAESSSWDGVITPLLREGYPVRAIALPLRGLASDVQYVASTLRSIPGPLVLVGHSFGGMVVSGAAQGNAQVKALVFVNAFAPEQGETASDLAGRFPGATLGPTLTSVTLPDGGKDLYIQPAKYHAQFCADVPAAQAAQMAATQRPILESAFSEKAGAPAWKQVPSWFFFGSADKNIPVAAHRFMAQRAGARQTIEVKGASHVAGITHAAQLARLIEDAAKATAGAPSAERQGRSAGAP